MPLFVSILSILFLISIVYIFITFYRNKNSVQIHEIIQTSIYGFLFMILGLSLIKLTDVLDMKISRDDEFLMYSVEIVLYVGVVISALHLYYSSKKRDFVRGSKDHVK